MYWFFCFFLGSISFFFILFFLLAVSWAFLFQVLGSRRQLISLAVQNRELKKTLVFLFEALLSASCFEGGFGPPFNDIGLGPISLNGESERPCRGIWHPHTLTSKPITGERWRTGQF